jgi:predicted Zn-dependent peptidase
MTSIRYDRFMETVHDLILPNGMRVRLLPKDLEAVTTYVELSVPFGAVHLNLFENGHQHTFPAGIAHFLEHKMFAMPDGDAFRTLSRLGADANAMTSYQTTSYVFSATENVEDAILYLLEMIDTPFFNDMNVDAERMIIKEELNMYLDDPQTILSNTLMENMYHIHPVRHDILGSEESLDLITADVLKEAYEACYKPSNRLIVIAGKADPDVLVPLLERYARSKPDTKTDIITSPVLEPDEVMTGDASLDLGLGISKMLLGFKIPATVSTVEERIRRDFAMSFLLSMLFAPSSDFVRDMTEESLLNQNFHVTNTAEEGVEHVVFTAETKDPDTIRDMIIKTLGNALDHGMSEDVFARVRKSAIGRFVYAFDSPETKTYLDSRYVHQGSSLHQVLDIMESVTFPDVMDALAQLSRAKTARVVGY